MVDYFDSCQTDGYILTPERLAAIGRAHDMVKKDHKQRWVTLDCVIHETPVPYRDAWSITRFIGVAYRPRILAHSAV